MRSEWPLLLAWTRKEYSVRYRQSLLGLAWSLVQPVATLAIFGSIMAGVLKVSSDGLPYISFAYAGLVPWTFVSSVFLISAQSLLNANATLGKVYVPREVVPLAQVLAFAVDLGIGTALLIVIALAQGIGVSVTIVALVPIYLVLVCWVAAIATIVATLTVFIRDLRYVVPLAVQLLFIATPIMYSPQQFPHRAQWVNHVNPIAVVVQSVRDAMLTHVWPDWSDLLLHGLVAVLAFLAAVLYVRSVEPRIVDVM
jgi:lipopolysaccharide transport system permease protein